MRAEISSAVHKHKVAPEGKGAGRDLGSLWARMWSIASIDARPLLFAFSLCAGAAAYFLAPDEPRLALCGLAWLGAGLLLLTARRGDSGLDVQVGTACRNRPWRQGQS